MGIKFFCPNGHKLNVKPHLAGKRAVCPRCGAKIRIPLESQTVAANFDEANDFEDPRFQDFDPQGFDPQGFNQHGGAAGRPEADRYQNPVGPARNGTPDLYEPDFDGPDDGGAEDDVLWTEETAAGPPFGDEGPVADTALNEAAFLDDPLEDHRSGAALADAAMSDPALGDRPPEGPSRGESKPVRPMRPATAAPPAAGPPPLRPRPAAPGAAASSPGHSARPAPRPQANLHPMSGQAVDEVIAAASVAPQPRPRREPQPDDDPIVRFRLQRERRNRIMMWLSVALALITLALAIVLIVVLSGQPTDDSADGPASSGKEPAATAPANAPNLPAAKK
ncbi:MAG TPA: hypothetical protein VMF30_12910 [Pirellulales bacterium]|nr:hypothetical protein [Pirellulales bacterium]